MHGLCRAAEVAASWAQPLLVASVAEGSPAANAGVVRGSVLLSILSDTWQSGEMNSPPTLAALSVMRASKM